MEYKTGNLLEYIHAYNYLLVTTNSFIKKDLKLVMGRGFAEQIRNTYPGIDAFFGDIIYKTCGHLGFYGVIFHGKFGAFQVKYHYMKSAEIDLVQKSTDMLINIANRHPTKLFGMNCPAIGNGKLQIDVIHPIINNLPNNVHVWRN